MAGICAGALGRAAEAAKGLSIQRRCWAAGMSQVLDTHTAWVLKPPLLRTMNRDIEGNSV